MLEPDAPITTKKDDLFGFAPLAERIAKSIRAHTRKVSVVIGIYGEWGAGKSSLMNLIEEYLPAEDGGESPTPLVMRFNPWLFSGRDDLVNKFFAHLIDVLARAAHTPGKSRLDWRTVAKYAVQLIPEVEPVGGFIKNLLSETIDVTTPNIQTIRRQLVDELMSQDQKIVVFIDDIDRLEKEEMRQIFQLVKLIADFPNVVYVLGLDHEYVAKTAFDTAAVGHEYIEKIVQVPFTVPRMNRSVLENRLVEWLNELQIDNHIPKIMAIHQRNVLSKVVPFLNSPRDVLRVMNSFEMVYSVCAMDVNAADLLALEILRIFEPKVHSSICNNKDSLCGFRNHSEQSRDKEYVLHLNEYGLLCSNEKNQLLVRELLPVVFPIFNRTADDTVNARDTLRICHSDIFMNYFEYSMNSQILHPKEVWKVMQPNITFDEMAKCLRDLYKPVNKYGSSQIFDLLNHWASQLSRVTIAEDDAVIIFRTLLLLNEEITERSGFANSNNLFSANAIKSVLDNVVESIRSEEELVTAFTDAIASDDISYLTAIGLLICRYSRPNANSKVCITADKFSKLKLLWLAKATSLKAFRKSLSGPIAFLFIEFLFEWDEDQKAQEAVQQLIQNDACLLDFVLPITRLAQQYRSSSIPEAAQQAEKYWSIISPVLTRDVLKARLDKLLTTNADSSVQERAKECLLDFQPKNE
jgi:hypothetical protein